MELSTDLIKQFVDVTNDSKTTNESKTTHRATAVVNNKGIFVKLDGSDPDVLTPVSMATDARDGDRVLVTIENHHADIVGNITSPGSGRSASDLYSEEVQEDGTIVVKGELRVAKEYVDELAAKDITAESIKANLIETENLKADNIEIKENLTANNADIKNLKADNVEIKENLTANNADIKDLKADNVEIKENLTAHSADIKDLKADNVEIKENLTANNADIKNLKTDNVEIKENLTAHSADIKDLKAEKLSAKDAELTYANIDFSNIGKAAMEYFYANSGLIKDVVIGDATISGSLVGVTISGDLIEGNTIVAEKLVVKGGDGLYYKLNIEGGSTVTEQLTEEMLQNGLDGNNIIANTITAEKIAVDDLIAFDATIGGFTIGENSLYSGVKESVDNTTRGIYFDTYGQMNIGDASNFIKYYKDANGKYRLEISAKSVKFGVSGTNLEDELETIKDESSEAAKEAYNKAQSAQDGIDNLEIGGRNLFIDSRKMAGYIASGSAYGNLSAQNSVNNEWTSQDISCSEGDSFVLQVWRTVPESVTSQPYWRAYQCYAEDNSLIGGRPAFETINSVDANGVGYSINIITIPSGAVKFRFSASLYDDGYVKIEKGNRATDWTPAPEDVDEDINDAQSTAEDAQTTAAAALESFEVISGYFESLVVDENGESLMEQTGEGWNFNLGPISSKLKNASDDIDAIQNDITASNANIENLQKSVNKLNELGVYVRISTYENEPCIELGDNSDPTNNFKLIITNKRILFFENGATPTWIANRKLYIETAEVTNELQFGNFAWKVHGTNGNMGLVWKGAD